MTIFNDENDQDYEIFELGTLRLQSKMSIPNAFLAYKTHGDPKNPAILVPSWYTSPPLQNLI